MTKKPNVDQQDLEADLLSMGTGRLAHPTRMRSGQRKSAKAGKAKIRKSKQVRRKGSTIGGMHQRGDKRVNR